jgi:hypothetical protein
MYRVIVTAYYPLKKSKYSEGVYNGWLSEFFYCVTCPVIFFCPPELVDTLKSKSNSNVTFVARDFDSWDMMKEPQMSKWREWWKIDKEKNIHSPELYAIWAAKQEFVREAINLVKSDIYIWCDAGCFRTRRDGSFKNVEKYIQPSKITCLNVTSLTKSPLIGGGVLAGDKNAWANFSKLYLDELSRNIHGKDQVIFNRVLNSSNAVILMPTNKYGDAWFYLTYIFSF